MDSLLSAARFLTWTLLTLTLFGLYRPWLALWWLPVANRKKVLQTYGILLLILIVARASIILSFQPPQTGQSESANKPILFYLHGRIIEDQGANAVSERYGRYEYDSIVQTFDRQGFTVKSEVRPRNTDVHQYADRVTRQIKDLLAAGIEPENITVVGASKGAVIAMLVSTNLQNSAVNFVLIAGCNDWVRQNLIINLCGRVLSIYEASDKIGQSCTPFFKQADCPVVHQEIQLNTGLAHGVLYRPRPAWIDPTIGWARKE